MRNDARPIGEAMHHDDERRQPDEGDRNRVSGRERTRGGEKESGRNRYLTDRDPGDEETDEETRPADDAMLRTKI